MAPHVIGSYMEVQTPLPLTSSTSTALDYSSPEPPKRGAGRTFALCMSVPFFVSAAVAFVAAAQRAYQANIAPKLGTRMIANEDFAICCSLGLWFVLLGTLLLIWGMRGGRIHKTGKGV